MKLLIPEPRRWFAYADERNFFVWLESITAVKRVVRVDGGKLQVTIKLPVSYAGVSDLAALLLRYNLSTKSLNALLTEKNSIWVKKLIDPARRSKSLNKMIKESRRS